MQLESLPNELLLNLFEWFDTIQLFHVFFGLNLRLNQLIYTHSRNHQFNLQSISKNDFDIICQQHLPLILDQILSLHLSNEETPELTKLFLSRGFLIDQFICLKSLSLHCIYSLDTLIIITYQCSHLLYLTHLNIIKCDIRETQNNIADLFENIWNIPKLLHCKLNIIELQNISLSRNFPVSSTIKYLFIENISCDLNCLFHLFKCTPYLQKFSTKINPCFHNMSSAFIVPSITSLKIFCEGSIDLMKKIFSNMPNLYHLTIETFKKYLDGNAWKQIIIDYLPKIKIFQLKMRFKCSGNINNIEQIFNNLLTSFRSSFWIEERRWYVRCHWNRSDPYSWMTLYTLPYAFHTFDYLNKCRTKSTCLDEGQYWPYDRVQMFHYDGVEHITLLNSFILVCTQFPNLRYLNITLSFYDDFHPQNVILNKLYSLKVTILNVSGYRRLQTLFDWAPCLYSVEIISSSRFSDELFQLTSKSIRRLSLRKQNYWWYQFSKEECIAFSHSQLGRQCEVLSIEIEDRTSIIDLIQTMSHLRLLNFRCRDDTENLSTKYELINWIQNHFSSTYIIIRDPQNSSFIQVWIDQHKKLSKRNASISKGEHKMSQLLRSIQRFFSRK